MNIYSFRYMCVYIYIYLKLTRHSKSTILQLKKKVPSQNEKKSAHSKPTIQMFITVIQSQKDSEKKGNVKFPKHLLYTYMLFNLVFMSVLQVLQYYPCFKSEETLAQSCTEISQGQMMVKVAHGIQLKVSKTLKQVLYSLHHTNHHEEPHTWLSGASVGIRERSLFWMVIALQVEGLVSTGKLLGGKSSASIQVQVIMHQGRGSAKRA